LKSSTLIDADREGNGLYHSFDTETGEGTFTVIEDCEPLLDLNQKAKNAETGNWKEEVHHVASIPPTVWANWWKEFGGNPMLPENQPRLMAKLNDRDNSKLRVKSGRL
jgi:hypothetical protein